MIQLQPREYFTIVRQLPDPGDVTVYFVRATIRNSRTDELIDTVVLVDRGGQRFSEEWQVPADVSGLGFYIDITTNVFDDAGYTTPSTIYGRDNESFLVFDRFKRIGGGSSGGAEVNYKKIATIFKEVLSKEEKMEVPETDLSPVMDHLVALRKCLDEMELPEMEKLDLSPVLEAVEKSKSAVITTIEKKEVTEATDISPVLDAISGLDTKLEEREITQQEKIEASLAQFEALRASFEKMFKADYPDLAKMLDQMVAKLREGFAYSTAVVPEKPNRAKSLAL